jgi:bifunctional UDP-N-acetylglucosamine pyrophosphorylase/glucosamine-1-phosphate N-acetyltransferase
MPLKNIAAIVLAAGQGKRMKSNRPKVLHHVLGQPMLTYVLDSLYQAGFEKPIVVVGHSGDAVVDFIKDRAQIAWQKEQLGTGHAVRCALPLLDDFEGDVIVTNGDVPLVPPYCYSNLVTARRKRGYGALISSIVLDKAGSYGRIKRDGGGDVEGIVEFRDASEEEVLIREVNSGTYCFNADDLREAIVKIKNHNAQGEYYLTDTISYLRRSGKGVGAAIHPEASDFLGINDPADLALVESRLGDRVKHSILSSGVRIDDPASVRIEPRVQVGARTRIMPGVILEGRTTIGEDCMIGPHVTIRDAVVPDKTTISPHLLSGPVSG